MGGERGSMRRPGAAARLPLPFRVLYRLTHKRHGRLTALALRGAV